MAKLLCIQINMGKRRTTHDIYMKWLEEQRDSYIISCIQEPYFKAKGYVGLPWNYSAYFVSELRGKKKISRAIVIAPKNCEGYLVTQNSSIDCAIVRFPKLEIVIISGYCDIHKPIREMYTCIEREVLRESKVVCCLDANAYSKVWGSKYKKSGRYEAWARGTELLNNMENANFAVANIVPSPPTYRNESGKVSWIDVTFVSSEILYRIEDWSVGKIDFASDHELISFKISGKEKELSKIGLDEKQIIGIPWKKMTEKMKQIVSNEFERVRITQKRIRNTQDLNIFLDKHISQVKKALRKVYRPREKQHRPVYWWTEEVKEVHRECVVSRRRAKKYRHVGLWEVCREKRRIFNKVVSKVKLDKWYELVEGTNDPWEKLVKILKASDVGRANERTLCDTRGLFAEDMDETLDKIMTQFFPIPIPKDDYHNRTEAKVEEYLKNYKEGPKFTICELYIALKAMNRNSAPGLDEMTMNIIDLILKGKGMMRIYLSMYNCSLRNAYVPRTWKKSKVILIPKQGLETDSTKAFRPISLTSNLCKIMERVVLQRVQHHIELSGKLSPSQHAYRKGGSTLTALFETINFVENAITRREVCVVVFLYISGAFDMTWHYGILSRLLEYGVPPYLVKWVKSFLGKREAEMTITGLKRNVILEQGCPQGRVLSPVLWNVLFNDFLLIDSSHKMKIVGYADDAAVMCTAKTVKGASAIASNVLRKISRWAKANRVTFNAAKLKAMTIHMGSGLDENEVWFEGNRIEEVTQHKYLGVIMDNKLTWKQHFEATLENLDKVIRILRPTIKGDWGLKSHIYKLLYHAIFKPIMMYAAPIWGRKAVRMGVAVRYDRIIRKYCLMTTRCFRSTSNEVLFRIVGTDRFKDMVTHEVQIVTMTQMQVLDMPRHNVQRVRRPLQRKSPISMEDYWDRCRKQLNIPYLNVTIDDLLDHYRIPPNKWIQTNTEIKDKTLALWKSVDMRGWIIYGDASVTSYGAGWSIIVFNHGLAIARIHRSSRRITPFTAEVQAIVEACKYILDHLGDMQNRQVIIRSDAQAVIVALERVVIIDPILKEAKTAIDKCMRKGVRILLQWVPSHSGIIGNEMADCHAKLAVDSALNKDVPEVMRDLKMNIHHQIRKNREILWDNLEINTPKVFFPLYKSFKAYQEASCLPNTNQLITGHCKLNSFLFHKIQCVESPKCICGEEEETVEHFFLTCKRHTQIRKELWGKERCTFEDVIGEWSKIKEYVKRTERFKFCLSERQ